MATNIENKIKVSSITFNTPPFRKLRNCRIDIADRITLIAGHNGIGKSTILGLLSNTFGITDSEQKSYFREPFYTNIERIIYVALNEVDINQESPSSAPIVEAAVEERIVRKRCSLTRRTEYRRARMVPRTVDPIDDDWIGPDAKIPLPAIYLGMRRLASVGEADEKEVTSTPLKEMEESDRQLIADFVNSVIIGSDVTNEITHQSIRGVRKRSVHPGYPGHETLAISMGQDSLGSIATALASFNRLQRELGEAYPGGLLIIDEMDVGFHPHAIDRLILALKTKANQLRLQIVATTHSPRMIAALHPDGTGDERAPDSVIYLVDTRHPRLAEDQSLEAILGDMALEPDPVGTTSVADAQKLCVYFEDTEAMQFCEALISRGKRGALSRKLGHSLKLISLGVGGSILAALPNNDPIFRDRVLVVDSDTKVTKKANRHGNIVKLPCTRFAAGTDRSPENTIKNFLRAMCESDDGPLHDALRCLNTRNPTSNKIKATFFLDGDGSNNNRERSKAWWRKHWKTLNRWGVLPLWGEVYSKEAEAFVAAFTAAATRTAERL